VAEAVVEQLEVVDVDGEHRQRLARRTARASSTSAASRKPRRLSSPVSGSCRASRASWPTSRCTSSRSLPITSVSATSTPATAIQRGRASAPGVEEASHAAYSDRVTTRLSTACRHGRK
jgi:hypothetical protein